MPQLTSHTCIQTKNEQRMDEQAGRRADRQTKFFYLTNLSATVSAKCELSANFTCLFNSWFSRMSVSISFWKPIGQNIDNPLTYYFRKHTNQTLSVIKTVLWTHRWLSHWSYDEGKLHFPGTHYNIARDNRAISPVDSLILYTQYYPINKGNE